MELIYHLLKRSAKLFAKEIQMGYESRSRIAMMLSNEFQASNLEVAPRTIDGSDGVVAAGYLAGDKIYNSIYNVDIGPFPRHLVCKIFSDYPWEEGTLSLLKTIHVEKVNSAS